MGYCIDVVVVAADGFVYLVVHLVHNKNDYIVATGVLDGGCCCCYCLRRITCGQYDDDIIRISSPIPTMITITITNVIMKVVKIMKQQQQQQQQQYIRFGV